MFFLGCQNYEDSKNGVRRWDMNIRGEKNYALVDSLLLELLTNSRRKRQTSLAMSFVTLYLTAPRFESQNCEDRKKRGAQMGGIIRGGKKLGVTALSLVLLKL